MRYVPPVLLALALALGMALYGGIMRPVFALPTYFLIGLAGFVGLLSLRRKAVARAETFCLLSVFALASWLIWRGWNSPDPWLASSYLRLILACLTTYLVFAVVITNPLHRLVFVGILFILGLLQAGLGAWQFTHDHLGFPLPWFSEQIRLSYTTRLMGRAHGFYLNANHLAWFLNIAVIFALAVTIWGRWGVKTKLLTGYVALMVLVGSLLTLSRGGMLALAGGLAAFFFFGAIGLLFAHGDRRLLGGLTLMIVLSLTALTWVYQGSFLFQGRLNELMEDSYRPQVALAAFRQFQLEPLLGTGAGTFVYYGREFRNFLSFNDDIYAHNDWLQLAGDFGFPALILLFVVLLVHVGTGLGDWIRLLRRNLVLHGGVQSHGAAVCLGALSSLAVVSIHSFFDFNMQIPVNAVLAAACLGMVANVGIEGVAPRPIAGLRVIWVLMTAVAGVSLVIASCRAGFPEYRWLRAENALLSGRWQEAVELAEQGLASAPSHSRLHRTMGEALFLQGKYAGAFSERAKFFQRALVEFSTATDLAPMNWINHRLYAEALWWSGRFQKASDTVIDAIALNPTQGGPWTLYGHILENERKFAGARQIYLLSSSLPGNGTSKKSLARVTRKLREEKQSAGDLNPH